MVHRFCYRITALPVSQGGRTLLSPCLSIPKMVHVPLDKRISSVYTVYSEYIQYERGDFLKLVIRNTAGVPIYEQIKEQVKAAVYAGELVEGEALPSIRQLARDLKISVITTSRAYADLEQEGFLTSVPGKGFFVLPQNTQLLREQALREMETQFAAGIAAGLQAGLSQEELQEAFLLLLKEESYG